MLRYLVIAIIVAWLATTAGITIGATAYLGHLSQGYTPAGLSVAGLKVGRMPFAEVETRIAGLAQRWREQQIAVTYPTVTGETKEWKIGFEEIGLYLDAQEMLRQAMRVGHTGGPLQRIRQLVAAQRYGASIPPEVRWHPDTREEFLTQLQRRVEWDAVPPRYDHLRRRVVPGRRAQTFDPDATWARIVTAVRQGQKQVEAAVSNPSPDWAETLGPEDFAVEIASFSTPMGDSDSARASNIRLAAEYLNGRILFPGDVLSFNEEVGNRTVARGFRPAPEIINQKLVDGIGGGVCQVSSTLYNAGLLSGMEIVARRNHSLPLGYIPLGRDATVYDGVIDLQMANPFPFPIAIAAGVEQWRVWIKVVGQKRPYEGVELETRGMTVIPRQTNYVSEDGKLSWSEVPEDMVPVDTLDEGRDGYRVSVYRMKEIKEKTTRELISTDYYPPSERVMLVVPRSQVNPLE